MNTNIQALAEKIKAAKHITILSGAGISTESGIPDFRSATGFWSQGKSREELMSVDFLQAKPKEFWPIYKEIFQLKLQRNYHPNSGHIFLKQLEESGKRVSIITQNIDGLHQAAGSKEVYEVHGTLMTAHCPKCKQKYPLDYVMEQDIPRCSRQTGSEDTVCGFILHPDVVLFGAAIQHWEESITAALQADLMLIMGSSLYVGPINQLPLFVKRENQTPLYLVNRESTPYDDEFDGCIYGELREIIAQLNALM